MLRICDHAVRTMTYIHLRLYASLNRYLPPHRRQVAFRLPIQPGQTLGDVIDQLGVPRDEIALITADGQPVGVSHSAGAGERIALYPEFHSREIAGRLMR